MMFFYLTPLNSLFTNLVAVLRYCETRTIIWHMWWYLIIIWLFSHFQIKKYPKIGYIRWCRMDLNMKIYIIRFFSFVFIYNYVNKEIKNKRFHGGTVSMIILQVSCNRLYFNPSILLSSLLSVSSLTSKRITNSKDSTT